MYKDVIEPFLTKYAEKFNLDEAGINELQQDFERIIDWDLFRHFYDRIFTKGANTIFGNDIYGCFWVNAECPDCNTYNWVYTGNSIYDLSAYEPDGFECRKCGEKHTWNKHFIDAMLSKDHHGKQHGYFEKGRASPHLTQKESIMMGSSELATKIAEKIIKDLKGRRGLSQEWEGVDEDIQAEIKTTWIGLAEEVLDAPDDAPPAAVSDGAEEEKDE